VKAAGDGLAHDERKETRSMSTQYITSLARAEAMLSLEGALDALGCFQMDLTDLCEELDRATKTKSTFSSISPSTGSTRSMSCSRDASSGYPWVPSMPDVRAESRELVVALGEALVRIIRAAEYVGDGEGQEAMQVLLDLERDLRLALQKGAALMAATPTATRPAGSGLNQTPEGSGRARRLTLNRHR
jgi:hypothetical protein